MPITGDHHKVVIWNRVLRGPSYEKNAVATAVEPRIVAPESLPNGPAWEVRIEIADPIKADQTRKHPISPDPVRTTNARGVVVCSVPRVSKGIIVVPAEARPPITAELQNLHRHH